MGARVEDAHREETRPLLAVLAVEHAHGRNVDACGERGLGFGLGSGLGSGLGLSIG